ncbi:MAG: Uma2 family endonuclease [Chloroflexi bacterium]|nr:Uma2 family endonuclease [Chloroflexota bacterium]
MALAIPVRTDAGGVKGPPQGRWTAADWERLPDDGNRYEIIEGVLYVSPVPSLFHQWSIWQFVELFGIPAKQQGLLYSYFAPIGVFMPGCEPVQPDFVSVKVERAGILHDRRIYGVPDLIVEVLSPGNADYDEDVKLRAYAQAGVPEYAVIDPSARQLRLYTLQPPGRYGEPSRFNDNDVVTFACAPGITFEVSRLFEGSPDTTV